jgi:dTDP-4-amino-4,6-dideoxygalactose transaminase
MKPTPIDRRDFLQQASAGAAGVTLAATSALTQAGPNSAGGQLAILGGKPVRTERFPSWPVVEKNDIDSWNKVLLQGKWCRIDGDHASTFEKAYAALTGTRYCVATANGTSALFASLNALDVGPGDEVLVSPYTFVATVNAILLQYALPVFVDSDRQTMQVDAKKMEAAVTPNTRCILPVHLGGNPADLDSILTVSQKHSLPVLEDACQAVLAEWRGKKLGSLGKCGCFSFQASKNLNSGEGGAVISNDPEFAERCQAFHNNGRGNRRGGLMYISNGANLRITEFQAALLLTQMTRVEEQSRIREENAKYLTKLLEDIPGITPARSYDGCTRNAYHLYMFRYDRQQFAGASREQFLKALKAEGIPASGGYMPLNKEPFLKERLNSRVYKSIYGEKRLRDYWERNHCPENDRLCEEAVWFYMALLLGKRSDMDQIADAIRKCRDHAGELAKV